MTSGPQARTLQIAKPYYVHSTVVREIDKLSSETGNVKNYACNYAILVAVHRTSWRGYVDMRIRKGPGAGAGTLSGVSNSIVLTWYSYVPGELRW